MKFIQIRTSKDLWERYVKLSKHHGMTLAGFIKKLLSQELEKYKF